MRKIHWTLWIVHCLNANQKRMKKLGTDDFFFILFLFFFVLMILCFFFFFPLNFGVFSPTLDKNLFIVPLLLLMLIICVFFFFFQKRIRLSRMSNERCAQKRQTDRPFRFSDVRVSVYRTITKEYWWKWLKFLVLFLD